MTAEDSRKQMGTIEAFCRLVLGFTLLIGLALVLILFLLLLLPWRATRIRAGNVYGHIVGRTIVWLGRWHTQWTGFERIDSAVPALYVSNHTSTLDLFTGMSTCPVGGCAVAKKEIARIPGFGQAYWLAGHLLIDRGDRESAIARMTKTAKFVQKNGLSVWMWPEGTRSPDGRLARFKKGFAHLAITTGLPIRPIVVHDAHQCWPARTMKLFPGPVRMEVLSDIDTSGWTRDSLDEHIDEVHRAFVDALAPHQLPTA